MQERPTQTCRVFQRVVIFSLDYLLPLIGAVLVVYLMYAFAILFL